MYGSHSYQGPQSCITDDVQFVVVGNNNVGKSSLCVTFSTGQFPSLFTPMECNRVPHEKEVTVGSSTVHVKCVDTEGHVRFPFL